MRNQRAAILFLWLAVAAAGQTAVTLTATTAPTSGKPGETVINITGSGFPAGTIPPANVQISLSPSGGGALVKTLASAVTAVVGTTRRVTFTIPKAISVSLPTSYRVSVAGTTSTAVGFASTNTATLTINPAARLLSVAPSTGIAGQSLAVVVNGQFTDFVQGATQADFGVGITVSSLTVSSPTSATVNVAVGANAQAGPRIVSMKTGVQVALLANGFGVTNPSALTISGFSPATASVGALVAIAGQGLQPNAGSAAQVTLAALGGGTLDVPATATSPTSLTFVVPAGAATGLVAVTVNGATATTATPLIIESATTFTLSAAPSAVSLIRGQSAGLAIKMASGNGFNQLTSLNVVGLPPGVTATFKPQNITAGQTSVLTLSAPVSQALGGAALAVSATASVDGQLVSATALSQLNVVAPTTSFIGRTVVDDSSETPLAGVTVRMLGKDGSGGTTGCTGQTVSDEAGNFTLQNLPASCTGRQLAAFDGTTATSPSGDYAGVNLVYTFASGQATASPVLVHLPRIDDKETFLVQQNAPVDQSYSYRTIPGLSLTVYAGTVFTMPDGSKPNPFPLVAVQVPVDRLPDLKPPVPTMMLIFIVAFQPANADASQPVAVFYPNTLNPRPGTNMPLLTLDPTRGSMVPYGTGTVSVDGTQVIPDPDPAKPGHRYGIIHFDWHGQMPPAPVQSNPGPPGGGGPGGGGPASGPGSGPGGSTGPGSGNGGNNSPFGNDGGESSFDFGGGSGDAGSCSQTAENFIPTILNPKPMDAKVVEPPHRVELALNLVPGSHDFGLPAQAGDPVDLFSGIQTISNTDIAISGSRGSIALVRNYRSLTAVVGPFGVGGNHNYNYALDSITPQAAAILNLIMPDGNRYPFNKAGITFVNSTIPMFRGATMTANADNSVDLRWKNGTAWHFTPGSFQTGSLLVSIRDTNSNTVTVSRDAAFRVMAVTDPVGRSLTFSYDASDRITTITDPIGRSAQYTYNTQGSLATVRDLAGGITRYDYDAQNNMVRLTDARGIVQAQNTLDSVGRVIRQVRPDGGVLNFSYTPVNPEVRTTQMLRTEVTDNLSVQASYRFNAEGFVTDVTSTQGQTRHTQPLPGNLPESVTEGAFKVGYTYDDAGNVLTYTDATGHITRYAYEPLFNKVTSITDPLGNITRFAYDGRGNLTSTTDANGNTTTFVYNANGLLTETTDALGSKTKLTYDAFGNAIGVTDPLGNTTASLYDGISRLIGVKDALGRQASATYDPLGRVLSQTDARSGVTLLTYDPDGNLLSLKDARNNTTTFTYDLMNRVATRTDPLGKLDTRTYDTNGNLTQFVDRRGISSAFGYDNHNRMVSETYPDATVARSYDALGRLTRVEDSASGAFTYAYDPAGRLLNSSTPYGAINYSYDGRGLMGSRQVVGQPLLNYGYDPAGNLASAAMPQAAASFSYNPRNQLSNINRLNGVSSSYSYDTGARLLSITHAKGATTIDAETYGYDTVGNRTTHATSIGQSPTTQPAVNQHNAANQLIQFGSVSNTYDANGNILQEGAASIYAWDARGRLKSIALASGQGVEFTYDFAGNMIQEKGSGPALNATKTFVLDDLTNIAHATSSEGNGYAVLAGRGIDSHLGITRLNAQTEYGLADAINSTLATVDEVGTLISRLFYDPYGKTTTASTFPFQFTGRVLTLSELYYYRTRFYSPIRGRFLSEDSIPSGNLYQYVGNSPQQGTDPTGLLTVFLGGSGTFVSGGGGQAGAGVYVNFDHGIDAGVYGAGGGGVGFDVGLGVTGGFVRGSLAEFRGRSDSVSWNLPVFGGVSTIISPDGRVIGGSLNGTTELPFPAASLVFQYTGVFSVTGYLRDLLLRSNGGLANYCRFRP